MTVELPSVESAGSPLLARPETENGDGDGFFGMSAEEVLVVGGPVLEVAVFRLLEHSGAGTLEEALALIEAWSPAEAKAHPRWPKGTPGGLGGKFMLAGQRFRLHGVDYDVDYAVPGGVYANVATLGNIAKAKHVFIPAATLAGGTEIPGVERPPADVSHYMNAAHYKTDQIKATVIDPYVVDDHDPSIPVPKDAPPGMTAERWQRFGRGDQLRYVDLMHQFGKWYDAAAQSKVDAELAKQPQGLVSFLKSAYHSQFGQSSGFTIGLLQMFSHWFQAGKKPSQEDLEKDREKYEQTKRVQDAAARVIQWDLYNRVLSPDITVFHKSHDSIEGFWKPKILSGKEPVFSGLSQSQRYTAGGFGPVGVATPLAIRNVVMATTSADIYPAGHFGGEQEVTVGEPIRMGSRSFAFNDSALTSGQRGWLTQQTEEGRDGTLVDLVRDAVENGAAFPALPEPPNLQLVGENTQWIAPPYAATVGIGKLGYADVDADGVPVAKPAKELDLKPGDYIEGMKGTRYIVIADPGSAFGVRYWKVTDSGQPVGAKKDYHGAIHDQATGHQAYSGHSDWAGSPESYEFQIELPFKKLSGHYDLPTQKAGVAEFVAAAWAISGDKKMVKDLPVGAKFYLNGVPYEVTSTGATSHVKQLATGAAGTINGGYQTTYLKLNQGYTEQGVPAFDPGAHFVSKPATLAELKLEPGDLFLAGTSGTGMAWQVSKVDGGTLHVVGVGDANQGKTKTLLPSIIKGRKLTPKPAGWTPPQVGDTLAWEGKKATVTKLLKDGKVQLNLAPGVVKIPPDHPALAGLFQPDKVTVGPKAKVKDMAVGQKFHAGSGGKIKPYVVAELGVKQKGKPGTFARVTNLDTGKDVLVSYQKTYSLLLTQHQTAPEPDLPKDAPQNVAEVFNPAAWKPVGKKLTHELEVGDKFQSPVAGMAEVVADKGAAWQAKSLTTGGVFPLTKSSVEVDLLGPSGVMPAYAFDPSAYAEGKPTPLGELHVGDIFKGTAKGKHYLVVKTGAKSGLTAVDLETGNKSGPWKYDKVAPLMYQKQAGKLVEKAKLVKGDPVLVKQLIPGDQFEVDGQVHELVAVPQSKGENATVAAVLPNGSKGFPGKVGWYPDLAVHWHANAAQAAEEAKALQASVAAKTDAELMPVGAIKAYSLKSKSGGGYEFTLLKNAGQGVVLEAKDGALFHVVKPGEHPVVEDSTGKAWKANGLLNLKVSKQAWMGPDADLSEPTPAFEKEVVPPPVGVGGFAVGDHVVFKASGEQGVVSFGTPGEQGVVTGFGTLGGVPGFGTDKPAVQVQFSTKPKPYLFEPSVLALSDGLGEPTPLPSHGLAFGADDFADNSLVKLKQGQMKPGTLFKGVGGTVYLNHGKIPGKDAVALEVVSNGGLKGQVVDGSTDHVPAEVGPVVPFAKGEWQPSGDAGLLSSVQPGDVYSVLPDVATTGELVRVLSKEGDKLLVVHSGDGGQSEPYFVDIVPGVKTFLYEPKAGPLEATPIEQPEMHVGAPPPGSTGEMIANALIPGGWKVGDQVGLTTDLGGTAQVGTVVGPGDMPGSEGKGTVAVKWGDHGATLDYDPDQLVPKTPQLGGSAVGGKMLEPGEFVPSEWEPLAKVGNGGVAPGEVVEAPSGLVLQIVGPHAGSDFIDAVPLAWTGEGPLKGKHDPNQYSAEYLETATVLIPKGEWPGAPGWPKMLPKPVPLKGKPGQVPFKDLPAGAYFKSDYGDGPTGPLLMKSGADEITNTVTGDVTKVQIGLPYPYTPQPAPPELPAIEPGSQWKDEYGQVWEVGKAKATSMPLSSYEMAKVPPIVHGAPGTGWFHPGAVAKMEPVAVSAPTYDTPALQLSVGSTFETKDGTKWEVVGNNGNVMSAEPVGSEGEEPPQDWGEGGHPDELVHVLSQVPGGAPPVEGAEQVFLSHVPEGAKVWWNGFAYTVGEKTKKPSGFDDVHLIGGTSYPDETIDESNPVWVLKDAQPSGDKATPAEWNPYSAKSKTGGGYKFADLGDLDVGAVFTDKTGAHYSVAGKTSDGVKFQHVSGGTLFFAPGSARVKVL